MRLVDLPSPLQPARRFSEAIGTEVWIKRDDVHGGPGLAGNKVRKLQRILPEALERGADTIVMVGAPQSNAARATAAACARLGLRCVLVLTGEPQPATSGNLLLDGLFGAELRWAGPAGWEALEQTAAGVEAELGDRAYRMPLGCSSPLGTLGMTDAWAELLGQLGDRVPAAVWHASSSGGTHAGFALGRALHGGPQVRAVGVAGDLGAYTGELALEAARLHGTPDPALDPGDLTLDLSQLGAGYGLPTPECLAAVRLLASTEGIVCDPVYSGKALAALVAGAAGSDGPVVFWHTGGWQACFESGYATALAGPAA